MSAAWTIDAEQSSYRSEEKRAIKRHRHFATNLRKMLELIAADPLLVGDRLRASVGHVRKVRIGVPEERLSSSGGYRLVFQVIEQSRLIILLDLLYKPERANITAAELHTFMQSENDGDVLK